LRQHLIDMDEVTMRAAAQKEPIDNGLRIKVTGSDQTVEAIQRMVPEHARDIDGMHGWTVRTTPLPHGVELTVTTSNPADAQKIRALGFMGIMVQAVIIRCIISPWPRANLCTCIDDAIRRATSQSQSDRQLDGPCLAVKRVHQAGSSAVKCLPGQRKASRR